MDVHALQVLEYLGSRAILGWGPGMARVGRPAAKAPKVTEDFGPGLRRAELRDSKWVNVAPNWFICFSHQGIFVEREWGSGDATSKDQHPKDPRGLVVLFKIDFRWMYEAAVSFSSSEKRVFCIGHRVSRKELVQHLAALFRSRLGSDHSTLKQVV